MIIEGDYKGKDISIVILLVLERVVSFIAEQNESSFEDTYKEFLASETYKNLGNPKTLMWAESVEFVVDEYNREMQLSNFAK